MDRIRQRIRNWLDENATDYGTDLYEYTETTRYGNTVAHVHLNSMNVCTYYTDHGIFGEEIHFPKINDVGNLRSIYSERMSEDAGLLIDGYDITYTEYYSSGVPAVNVGGYKWDSTAGHVTMYDEQHRITDEYDIPDTKAYLEAHRLH